MRIAGTTLRKFASGSPMPMSTMLVMMRFVADLPAELAVRQPHLADDLGGGEVAVEALLRGRAERAVERAAHLRGDAQRAAVFLGDVDHLEGLAVAARQQPLARAVGRRPAS